MAMRHSLIQSEAFIWISLHNETIYFNYDLNCKNLGCTRPPQLRCALSLSIHAAQIDTVEFVVFLGPPLPQKFHIGSGPSWWLGGSPPVRKPNCTIKVSWVKEGKFVIVWNKGAETLRPGNPRPSTFLSRTNDRLWTWRLLDMMYQSYERTLSSWTTFEDSDIFYP